MSLNDEHPTYSRTTRGCTLTNDASLMCDIADNTGFKSVVDVHPAMQMELRAFKSALSDMICQEFAEMSAATQRQMNEVRTNGHFVDYIRSKHSHSKWV
jgi:hypothetical protein